MTHDEIIKLAVEAGFELDCCSLEWHERISRFAALVAAAEREACALLCDDVADNVGPIEYDMGAWLAAAIRARGQS